MDDTFFIRQLPIVGESGQTALKNSSVLIAGAGGLGSLVLHLLARSGIGTLHLMDDGVVDAPDLNRQILYGAGDIGKKKVDVAREKLEGLGLGTRIFCHFRRITSDEAVPEGIHGIVDCLDNFEGRYILDDWVHEEGIFLVHGGIHGMWGQITSVIPGKTPTLRDIFLNAAGSKETIPVIGPVPAMVASLQAIETIKLLLNQENSLANQMLLIHLKDYTIQKIPVAWEI